MSEELEKNQEIDETPPVPGADQGPQDEEATVELNDDIESTDDYVNEEN